MGVFPADVERDTTAQADSPESACAVLVHVGPDCAGRNLASRCRWLLGVVLDDDLEADWEGEGLAVKGAGLEAELADGGEDFLIDYRAGALRDGEVFGFAGCVDGHVDDHGCIARDEGFREA